ncbi:MAG TPA: hypothetical protein VK158_03220 [Acidobacteriota bacterium]|nr:hypothetical protein [Acidobacteriota bacterium]
MQYVAADYKAVEKAFVELGIAFNWKFHSVQTRRTYLASMTELVTEAFKPEPKSLFSFTKKSKNELNALELNKVVKKLHEFLQKQETVFSVQDKHAFLFSFASFAKLTKSQQNLTTELINTYKDEFNAAFVKYFQLMRALEDEKKLLALFVPVTRIGPQVSSWIAQYKEILDKEEKALNEIMPEQHRRALLVKKFCDANIKIIEVFHPHDLQAIEADYKAINVTLTNKQEKMLKYLQEVRRLRSETNPKQFILVHKTDYFPKNGIILTTSQTSEGTDFLGRETVHFAVNGPVASHMWGNWSKKKIAILVPMENVISQVYAIRAEDTSVLGNVQLDKTCDIICENSLKEELANTTANGAKITFTTEPLDAAIKRRIYERGYVAATIGTNQMHTAGYITTDSFDEDATRELLWAISDEIREKHDFETQMQARLLHSNGSYAHRLGDFMTSCLTRLARKYNKQIEQHMHSALGSFERCELRIREMLAEKAALTIAERDTWIRATIEVEKQIEEDVDGTELAKSEPIQRIKSRLDLYRQLLAQKPLLEKTALAHA